MTSSHTVKLLCSSDSDFVSYLPFFFYAPFSELVSVIVIEVDF